jgi:hypothetical protein
MSDISAFDDQDNIEQHESAMMRAFINVIKAEQRISAAKSELDQHTARLKSEISAAEMAMGTAWDDIQALLTETGEVEVVLPGAANDYRIAWSNPRESVKVEDPSAVPDDFVKIERKPKLKEIGDYLKNLRKGKYAMPNWARLEKGESKLMWESIKKRVA